MVVSLTLILLAGGLGSFSWEYHQRPGGAFIRACEKIRPGMKVEEVNALLKRLPEPINAADMRESDDPKVAAHFPQWATRVEPGDKFYKWTWNDDSVTDACVIVRFRRGRANEKQTWEPSL